MLLLIMNCRNEKKMKNLYGVFDTEEKLSALIEFLIEVQKRELDGLSGEEIELMVKRNQTL